MTRAMVLGWLLLILTLSRSSWAEGEKPLRVVVLRAGTLDWPEARQSVEAELSATGFDLRSHAATAGTPGRLIDELRQVASQDPEAAGSVAVFFESGEGRAYVWIPERENLFQVDAPPESGRMAAQVLALRVVELLRVRLLDEPPKPLPPPEPEAEVRSLWAMAGPWLASGLSRPAVQLGLGASFRLMPPLELDVTAHLSALPATATTAAGTLRLTTTALTVHGLWLAHDSEWFGFAAGAGGGLVSLDGGGVDSDAFVGRNQSATAALLSLRARARVEWGSLALLLVAEPGVTLPGMVARADGSEVFRLGQPLFLLAGGLGWSK